MLNPRSIAVGGVGFGARSLAVHGLLLYGQQVAVHEVEIDFAGKSFRNPETWIPKKPRKIIQRLAREIVALGAQVTPIDATGLLLEALEASGVAYQRAFDDFLQQQVEDIRRTEIQSLFERSGIYREIEDDEQALMLLFMEL